MTRFKFIATIGAAAIGMLVFTGPAAAADNAMQVCGAKYQAAKKANQLPAGQTWNKYLAQCRAGMKSATPAPASAAASGAMSAAKPAVARSNGQPTPAQKAMYDRERQCGKMWQADKAAHKTPAGQTWPQYWSACNKRLKS
ncbi:MAG: hypothetical protein J7498_11520 [Sphingobium sp.]|nr:hypothetical protein [Sphingobium sp.]